MNKVELQTPKQYHEIVDSFIANLQARKQHLWELSADYNEESHGHILDMIHSEIEQINNVQKLYKKNKF